jgi:hypothetical protein
MREYAKFDTANFLDIEFVAFLLINVGEFPFSILFLKITHKGAAKAKAKLKVEEV